MNSLLRKHIKTKNSKIQMKKYLFIATAAISSMITMNSCKEDIDLVAGYKETAVVYGILDQSEKIHYVKIQRAFIGPGNSLDIAKIADSNYFENVEAQVVEYVNEVATKTWFLKDTLLENKNTDGAFFAPQQKLYYFTDAEQGALNVNAVYKLTVVANKGLSNEFTVTGETGLVSGIQCAQAPLNKNFNFYDPTKENKYLADNIFTGDGGTGNAHIVNLSMMTEFYEYQGTTLIDSASFTLKAGESAVEPGSSYSASIQGLTFYEQILASASNNPLIDKRQLKGITITITGGSEVLYNYMNANKPSSTLAQTKPSYTNLSVTNDKGVVGIFAARQTYSIFKAFSISTQNYRAIDLKSTKELCKGTITGNLFFCSKHNSDQNEDFACPL